MEYRISLTKELADIYKGTTAFDRDSRIQLAIAERLERIAELLERESERKDRERWR